MIFLLRLHGVRGGTSLQFPKGDQFQNLDAERSAVTTVLSRSLHLFNCQYGAFFLTTYLSVCALTNIERTTSLKVQHSLQIASPVDRLLPQKSEIILGSGRYRQR